MRATTFSGAYGSVTRSKTCREPPLGCSGEIGDGGFERPGPGSAVVFALVDAVRTAHEERAVGGDLDRSYRPGEDLFARAVRLMEQDQSADHFEPASRLGRIERQIGDVGEQPRGQLRPETGKSGAAVGGEKRLKVTDRGEAAQITAQGDEIRIDRRDPQLGDAERLDSGLVHRTEVLRAEPVELVAR